MKPVEFPDWVVYGRPPPRWPDVLIQVLRGLLFVLLMLCC